MSWLNALLRGGAWGGGLFAVGCATVVVVAIIHSAFGNAAWAALAGCIAFGAMLSLLWEWFK